MSYRRDFTIGRRETRRFCLSLALRHWWKGIAGFAAAGALVAVLYLTRFAPGTPPALQGAVMALAALAVAAVSVLVIVLSTDGRVRRQLRAAGRESYVQATEIDGFGIHVTVDGKKAKLPFDRLLRARETGSAIYLFLAEDQAWILPKDQMEDPAAECRQIREILRTVVPSGRLKLKKEA